MGFAATPLASRLAFESSSSMLCTRRRFHLSERYTPCRAREQPYSELLLELAQSIQKQIVLIDGDELARLMIRYNVGVREDAPSSSRSSTRRVEGPGADCRYWFTSRRRALEKPVSTMCDVDVRLLGITKAAASHKRKSETAGGACGALRPAGLHRGTERTPSRSLDRPPMTHKRHLCALLPLTTNIRCRRMRTTGRRERAVNANATFSGRVPSILVKLNSQQQTSILIM